MRFLPAFASAALLAASLGLSAHATTITPTFGAAGAETVDQTSLCSGTTTCVVGVETYDTRTSMNFTTDFGTNGLITGAYSTSTTSPSLSLKNADQYGGAGDTGKYPELFTGSYTLNLSTNSVPGVNYFGLWISALDNNNDLKFYSNGALVLDFTPTLMSSYIAKLSNASAYKGNPTDNYADSGEYFAFVNFIATDGTFDQVVFSNSNGTGFESDNATVAYRTPGTSVFGNAIPEPASMLVMVAGLAGLGVMRRRFAKTK